MKIAFVIAGILFVSASHAFASAHPGQAGLLPLPAGKYVGTGQFTAPNKKGIYTSSVSVGDGKLKSDSVATTYHLPDGSTRDWVFELLPQSGNLAIFSVRSHGIDLGSG